MAERGENLGNATARLLRLLDTYGAAQLERALVVVLAEDVPHPGAVRQVLEQARAARGLPPAAPLMLPDLPQLRGLDVRPHPLADYDAVGRTPSAAAGDPQTDTTRGGDDGQE